MTAPREFDPLNVSLSGVHLVEASAGTGKTWSIVSLLLRAIALDGLAIDSAVIVTFTEAATRELRQRLRVRLEEAARALDGLDKGDDFIGLVRSEAARRDLAPALLRQRVADALVRCDEAWVHTIHGLCARWMREFAFEQQLGLEAWPVEEGSELRQQAVEDVWRQRVVLADADQARVLLHVFKHSANLLDQLKPLLAVEKHQVDGEDAEARLSALTTRCAELRAQLVQLEASGEFDRLWDHLDEGGRYSGSKLSAAHKRQAREWVSRAVEFAPALDVDALHRVGSGMLLAARNKSFANSPLPQLAALPWIDGWIELRADLASVERLAWTHRLLDDVRTREQALRLRQRCLSYDDLVLQMRNQLRGDSGERFAQQLARRFPLAVVDEFQDTDAAQYAIFRAVYFDRAESGLFLVGDPKQAIYRFRGGDIFAYRQAMNDASERHSLRYNRRSQLRTVAAVNQLFAGHANPFVFEFIDFAAAKVPPEVEVAPPNDEAGLTVWHLPKADGPLAHGLAEKAAIEAVAAEIALLVETGLAPEQEEAPVAVLVGKHAQAQQMRRALAKWGIACAYSGEASVWTSDAARALLTVIDALAKPRDAGRQRRVLVGPLFNLDADALIAEGNSAGPREQALDALSLAGKRVARSGPAAALLPLIADAASAQLRRAEGRRWLADALHVLDLISEHWVHIELLADLAEWMQQAIARSTDRARKPADSERMRPETDRARVRLMTVHGSKGLQFDYVFAPFLWSGAAQVIKQGVEPRGRVVSWHGDDGELRRDPGGAEWLAHAKEDAREQFAESLRLTYVALTRAKIRSWIVWGDTLNSKHAGRSSQFSPLAYLFAGDRIDEMDGVVPEVLSLEADVTAFQQGLEDWANRAAGAVTLLPLAAGEARQIVMPNADEVALPRTFNASLAPTRRVHSYSGLFAHGSAADAERPDHDHATISSALLSQATAAAPAGIGGTKFGECAHAALEIIDFARWPDAAGGEAVASACRRFGYGADAESYLSERIDTLCRAPLIDDMRFGQLTSGDRLAELEFFFPLHATSLTGFYAAIARAPRYARAEHLAVERLSGFMRGFIDLTVRWQGRYYVLDYKTNQLGASLDAYTQDALSSAIRASSYDLQYLLYTLAVHRHLRARLGDQYEYSRDFGGVCYVYLRGLDASGRHGVFVDRPELAVISALDAWADGATAS